MDREFRGFAERAVTALERLAADPIVEIEAAPPICPHCGYFNPTVVVEKGMDGPLSECVLQVGCTNCNQAFYAMPVTWHMHTTIESIRQELQERAALLKNGEYQDQA